MHSLLLLLLLPAAALAAFNPDHTPTDLGLQYAADCLADKDSVWDDDRLEKKWYKIDLDAEEHDRCREVAEHFTPQIQSAIDLVKNIVYTVAGDAGVDALLNLVSDSPDKLSEPYKTEIKAMGDLTGIPMNELTLLNMFYELGLACTSIVAIDHNGKVFHGRNLDFGLFFQWNIDEHTWELTRALKSLLAQYEFYKDGKLLFKAVGFGGHLGILTGVRKGVVSVTLNSRFGADRKYFADFFDNGLQPNEQFVMYALRDVLTNSATFDEAKQYMSTEEFMVAAYITMGHSKGGVVLERSELKVEHEMVTDVKQENGWYVLKTNWDDGQDDMFLDPRTVPGNKCMQKLGRKRLTKEGLFQVLSSKTTLNKSTVYTSIMEIDTGDLYTFKQVCADPCWFV